LRVVQALLTDLPRRRDLPIEHLHLIQGRYGHLDAAHLAALAFAPVRTKLADSLSRRRSIKRQHVAGKIQ
jgi:hypothetical protein